MLFFAPYGLDAPIKFGRYRSQVVSNCLNIRQNEYSIGRNRSQVEILSGGIGRGLEKENTVSGGIGRTSFLQPIVVTRQNRIFSLFNLLTFIYPFL